MSAFIRLHITAEGQTEERFVKDTLAPHLGAFHISTDVRRVLVSKDKRRHYRGGLLGYEKAKKDIQLWMKEDRSSDAWFTTMFDLYALPQDFPDYADSQKIHDPYKKVECLETAMQKDLDDFRFIPYIQLHEFEALVLANPDNLELEYFTHAKAINALQHVLQQNSGNPELINDGKLTAPSKRILQVIPEYDKVNVGASIAGITGIDFLKNTCRHFGDWVEKLERLSS